MATRKLANKRILLGLTGGIAAYKSADLTRRLREQGASVRVVMTAAATEFITPLTLQALSGNPVHTELLDASAEAAMGHIELARWADIVLVAPATANFMARLCHGIADDLLATLCLATEAPLLLAPAMNQAMWRNAATQDNCKRLLERGVGLLGPASGEQACGDTGPGRMLEPGEIIEGLLASLGSSLLQGQQVLITAGPTREALDPVRYVSNNSSGKMGFALAQAAAEAGADTVLVSGPVSLADPPGVERIRVESAREMHAAVMARVAGTDIFIGAAAVADYRASQIAEHKIKKNGRDALSLDLVRNPDIVAEVAATGQPFTVGFAAETENLIEHARGKLERKGLDMIIANDVSRQGIGFDSDYNAVTVLTSDTCEQIAVTGKQALARQLIGLIAARRQSLGKRSPG